MMKSEEKDGEEILSAFGRMGVIGAENEIPFSQVKSKIQS